ncbi:unnamed protein product [Medioppia subpectinata]|uniref:Uncharacterized protein n=1 Tax=Medioppia subpectinata TaxID=1979941 RepID=A0A7R9KEN6_9ACAR|nr:unnamed protein product [Medioppia subpectinata]CAG2101195.1 unnamed protein product [Medioppia subpectinata]
MYILTQQYTMLNSIPIITVFVLLANMIDHGQCQQERYQEFGGAIMDAMDDQLITSCKNTINADVHLCEQGIRWDQYPDATTDEGKKHTCCRLWESFNCTLQFIKLYEIHKCTADESIAVQKYYNGQIITNNQHNCVSYPYEIIQYLSLTSTTNCGKELLAMISLGLAGNLKSIQRYVRLTVPSGDPFWSMNNTESIPRDRFGFELRRNKMVTILVIIVMNDINLAHELAVPVDNTLEIGRQLPRIRALKHVILGSQPTNVTNKSGVNESVDCLVADVGV